MDKLSSTSFIPQRRRRGVGWRRGLLNRRAVKQTEQDIRGSREVKFLVQAVRYRTWLPPIWTNTYTVTTGWDWNFVHHPLWAFTPGYKKNGDVIGRIIHPKRLTIDIDFNYNITTTGSGPIPITSEDQSGQAALISDRGNTVQVRVALIRHRMDPFAIPQSTKEERSKYMSRYHLLSTTPDSDITNPNTPFLPFNPSAVDVIREENFFLSVNPKLRSAYINSIPTSHHVHWSVPFKNLSWNLIPGIDGNLYLGDYTKKFAIYCGFRSITYTDLASPAQNGFFPEIMSQRVIKLSYTDG